MSEVRFYLKNPKAKKTSSIYLDFAYDGRRLRMPSGLSIEIQKWNQSKGRFKHQFSHEEWYKEFDGRLAQLRSDILSFYNKEHASGKSPRPEAIKLHLENMDEDNLGKSFFDVYTKFLKVRSDEVAARTIQKYKTVESVLKNFEHAKKYKIEFDSIDLNFFDEFKNYMYNLPNKKVPGGLGMLDTTVHKTVSVIKTFMTWAAERGYHDNQIYNKFSIPIKKREEIITLSIQDIQKIKDLDLSKDSSMDRIRDLFLFGFHTLQRWSDIENFKKDQLITDESGNYTEWKFITVKTEEQIRVPFVGFTTDALKVLDKHDFKLPLISLQKFNDGLKKLGKKAKLTDVVTKHRKQGNRKLEISKKKYKFMSSHIMRRSGITYLLEQGMAPTTILKLTGHEDIATLMKYENTSDQAVYDALGKIRV